MSTATTSALPHLTEVQFDILRDAVTLAKDGLGRTVEVLKTRLTARGYEEADVDAAILFWARYEKDKPK